jgi:hypothetical protein
MGASLIIVDDHDDHNDHENNQDGEEYLLD